MAVKALGYLGVRAAQLQDWTDFGVGVLGMAVSEQTRTTMALRMDERRRRLFIEQDDSKGLAFYGWEVADGAALSRLADKLDRAGHKVEDGGRALADRRGVTAVMVTTDPLGNRLELFHGAELANEAFAPGRPVTGFRTGTLGLGHVVLNVREIEPAMSYYRDLLGFKLTDYFLHPFPGYFLHVNGRHHSLALVQTGHDGIHHMMVEMRSLDDVGQGYDLAQLAEGRVAQSLGRHINDQVTSFYSWNPSGFMTEYGWGGRKVAQRGWQPEEITHGPSMWGHERYWMPEGPRGEGRALRLKAAAAGVRADLNLQPGTFKVARD